MPRSGLELIFGSAEIFKLMERASRLIDSEDVSDIIIPPDMDNTGYEIIPTQFMAKKSKTVLMDDYDPQQQILLERLMRLKDEEEIMNIDREQSKWRQENNLENTHV